MATTDWNPVLRSEFEQPYWAPLQEFVADERGRHTVYPPHEEVFAALHEALTQETLRKQLRTPPLQPLFSVR